MRVLVTGGAGFIGSAFCRLAHANGWSILNVDKLTYAASLAAVSAIDGSDRYQFVRGDICDGRLLADAFARFKPDAVAHFAAETHVDRSIDGSDAFIQTNIVGTHSLLSETLRYWEKLTDEARQSFRLIHISTDEVFGSLGVDGFFDEATSYAPRSPYSASKAASDHLARAWWHTYGLPTVISNCSNNYGPFQFPEKLIPLMIIKAWRGERLPVYGDGQNVRDWLFVDDHVRALISMITHAQPGATYCVGGRSERTNLQVVEKLCDILDEREPLANGPRRALVTFSTDRPGHDRRYAIDPSKLESQLTWQAEVAFEDGLKRTIEWYLQNHEWWGSILSSAYRGERLGLGGSQG